MQVWRAAHHKRPALYPRLNDLCYPAEALRRVALLDGFMDPLDYMYIVVVDDDDDDQSR